MTKSKAQKAKSKLARKGQQQKSNVQYVQLAPMPKAGKAKKARQRSNPSGNGFLSQQNTSVANKSYVVRNNAPIADRFVRRREKVSDVLTTTAFSVNKQFYINPGNTELFPIFSQIAKPYEQFKCHYLKMTYVPFAGIQTDTNNPGKVCLSTNYDPNDANFASITEAENYNGAIASIPTNLIEEVVQPKSGNRRGYNTLNEWFVNPSANLAAPTTDTNSAKFYDVGNFQLLTEGSTTALGGELWVEYEFTLLRPKQPLAPDPAPIYYHGKGVPTTSNPGAGMVATTGSALTSVVVTNTTLVLGEIGRFLIYFAAQATTSVAYASQPVLGAGMTAVDWFATEFSPTIHNGVSGSGSSTWTMTTSIVVDVATASAVFTMLNMIVTGAAVSDLVIVKLPGSSSDLVVKDDRLARLERMMSRLLPLEGESDMDEISGSSYSHARLMGN